MQPESLGYIIHLPRINKPVLTSLYLLKYTGILINHKLVQYILPKHAVVMNCTLKNSSVKLYYLGYT